MIALPKKKGMSQKVQLIFKRFNRVLRHIILVRCAYQDRKIKEQLKRI